MNKTPLLNALKVLNHDRYHIPGHKGKTPDAFANPFALDFTEIEKTGNLYEGKGPINESETLYSSYFGAEEIMYLTGGSTQGIMTAIFTANPKKMLCDRNSHKALANALGLIDCDYDFISPEINEEFDVPSKINPQAVENSLGNDNEIDTVYITSPNYYGITSDVESIAKICKKYGAKLIVDEAHGCHFPAIGVKNAMQSGADFAITSAHKTTESLGLGAVLMSSKASNMRKNASIFGSSSPSYLIMTSIENALSNLYNYENFIPKVNKLRKTLETKTKFKTLNNDDICRLVVNFKNLNINAPKIAEILENEQNIVTEMNDMYNIVFILTYNDENLKHLQNSLIKISDNLVFEEKNKTIYKIFENKRKLTVRKAMFSEAISVKLKDSAGMVSKEILSPYPPGVPIVYPGEIILPEHIEYLEKMCYNANISIIKL